MNYLYIIRVIFRSLKKAYIYYLFNFISLFIGISGCIFISLYVMDELSYDRHYEKSERIYRINSKITETANQYTWAITQIPLRETILQLYPEVEECVSFLPLPSTVFISDDNSKFKEERIYYTGQNVFKVFNYKFVLGSPDEALSKPGSMVICQSLASKYFGIQNPVGKSLRSDNNSIYKITGVIEDVPKNSNLHFEALISNKSRSNFGSWYYFDTYTYLLLNKGVNVNLLEDKLNTLYDQYMSQGFRKMNINVSYDLMNIRNIHLFSKCLKEPGEIGNIFYIILFVIVNLLLLVIACINNINISFARNYERIKVIGISKVLGIDKISVIVQSMLGFLIQIIIVLVISFIVVGVLMPVFRDYSSKQLFFSDLFKPAILLLITGIISIVLIFGGLYPAIFIACVKPYEAIKGKVLNKKSDKPSISRILIVIQFTSTLIILICTLIMLNQLRFMEGVSPGYQMEKVIYIQIDPDRDIPQHKIISFVERLRTDNEVVKVGSSEMEFFKEVRKYLFSVESETQKVEKIFNYCNIDNQFFDVLNIKIVNGENFSQKNIETNYRKVIVNESLVKRMNWSDPVNKVISFTGANDGKDYQVIGVVKDFYQRGINNLVEPFIFFYKELGGRSIYIAVNSRDEIDEIRKVWSSVFDDAPFIYSWFEDNYSYQFADDERRLSIFTLFTVLTILIACIGMIGLLIHTIEKKRKAISLYNIFGASILNIFSVFSKEYIIILGVSVILATPLAYLLTQRILMEYILHIDQNIWIYIISSAMLFFITLLLVFVQTSFAAKRNPVKYLEKNE